MNSVNLRIRSVLKENSVRQKELAAVSGYTITAVNQMLLGKTQPSVLHLQALKTLIPRISMDYILFGFGDKYELDNASN